MWEDNSAFFQLASWCIHTKQARLVRDYRKATVTQITSHYNQGMQKTISECTIRWTLKQMGYGSRKPHQVPLLQLRTGNWGYNLHGLTKIGQYKIRKKVAWFDESPKFTVLKWHPQSPNFNPIEHLWDVVQWEIWIMYMHPTNLQQLSDAMSIWTKSSVGCFQYHVESMPRRIKAVLRAKGGPTQY